MSKVVRIIGRMCGSGPSRQVAFLHRTLRRSFETVLVVGVTEEGEQDMRYLLQDSTGVMEVATMSRSVRGWADLVSLVHIGRILWREKPAIVHTHTAKAGVLGRIAGLLTGVPVLVHTYHGHVFQGYFGKTASRLIIHIERLLNRFTTRVIAISPSQAKDLADNFQVARRGKIVILRTGFDLAALNGLDTYRREARQRLGISQEEHLVVWAGRLVAIKNVPLLLDVVRLANRLPQLKFVVVGEGPLRSTVEEAARTCPNLRFLGWQDDMKPILAATDMVLLTSRNEGTPAFLIEAMAAGKPFISTAVGGVVDLAQSPIRQLENGCQMAGNGFLTSSDPGAILACLEILVASPEMLARMGAAGRSFAREYHCQERLAEEVTNLYHNLLAAEGVPEHAAALATTPEET